MLKMKTKRKVYQRTTYKDLTYTKRYINKNQQGEFKILEDIKIKI